MRVGYDHAGSGEFRGKHAGERAVDGALTAETQPTDCGGDAAVRTEGHRADWQSGEDGDAPGWAPGEARPPGQKGKRRQSGSKQFLDLPGPHLLEEHHVQVG